MLLRFIFCVLVIGTLVLLLRGDSNGFVEMFMFFILKLQPSNIHRQSLKSHLSGDINLTILHILPKLIKPMAVLFIQPRYLMHFPYLIFEPVLYLGRAGNVTFNPLKPTSKLSCNQCIALLHCKHSCEAHPPVWLLCLVFRRLQ